ncbi:MAG TPA: hypothetical protein VFU73_08620 [Actinocrinis sp.]|nr:hypothetical protein [Actinocrinis sp.]
MNPTVTTAATTAPAAAGAAVTTRILATAGPSAGSFAPRPLAAASAASDPFSIGSFTTSADVDGRVVEVPVSVNRHRARETYARATSVPLAVDPTAARTAPAAVTAAKAGRGKLAAASQWDR